MREFSTVRATLHYEPRLRLAREKLKLYICSTQIQERYWPSKGETKEKTLRVLHARGLLYIQVYMRQARPQGSRGHVRQRGTSVGVGAHGVWWSQVVARYTKVFEDLCECSRVFESVPLHSLHIGPFLLKGVCRDIMLRRTPDPSGPPFLLSYIQSCYLVTVPYI
jgi:hypothetical protein